MKICHVITSLDIGGAELVLYRLLQAQPENINNTLVVVLQPIGAIGKQLQQSGFSVVSLDVTGPFSLFFAIFKLTKILKKHKPAIVQSWLYHADFIASLSSYLVKSPRYFWGVHTCQLPSGKPITRFIMNCCARMSFGVPERIVCVAEASRQLHIESGYDVSKLVVIPNGFNVSDYQSSLDERQRLRQQFGFLNGVKYVGIIGRWHSDKGQDLALAAIAQLQKKQTKLDVFFVFVGRGCELENPQFSLLATQCTFAEKILGLGERNDIPDILKALDIFCLPSRTEAFPLALGEAMCAGLPAVATNVGDVKYMLGGILPVLAPNQPAELAACLADMLKRSEHELQDIGCKLNARAATFFSVESMVQRYQELYTSNTKID